jgi:hypothetical protein
MKGPARTADGRPPQWWYAPSKRMWFAPTPSGSDRTHIVRHNIIAAAVLYPKTTPPGRWGTTISWCRTDKSNVVQQ